MGGQLFSADCLHLEAFSFSTVWLQINLFPGLGCADPSYSWLFDIPYKFSGENFQVPFKKTHWNFD